ncbi:MAG: NAD(P)-dependent oxidoreductase [Planctomycetaceae bacterium]|nr:NAD(P)-dependent oxidoreductase [Planctomycetaceae bacterium]|tara:strand:+ start:14648 stop:15526 length:879 start_codon:yes stop_codon:yes gene_type:complete
MANRLIVGCGYLGQRVAQQWLAEGHQVYGLTRNAANAEILRQSGLEPLIGDVMEPEKIALLPAVEQVLYSVGFDRSSSYSIEEVYIQGLQNLVALLPQTCQRLIYISSTGVYGQDDGSWVTEDSVTQPIRAGGKACLAAEQHLLDPANVPPECKVTILRLAGIYGPGRVPRLDLIKQGKPLAIPSEGWLNLIHVDDAVTIVDRVIKQTPQASCYLVSDGCPVLRTDYLNEIASLLRAPEIRFTEVDAQSPATQRAAGTKRISNQRLCSEFPIEWKYPSYKQALAEILKNASA